MSQWTLSQGLAYLRRESNQQRPALDTNNTTKYDSHGDEAIYKVLDHEREYMGPNYFNSGYPQQSMSPYPDVIHHTSDIIANKLCYDVSYNEYNGLTEAINRQGTNLQEKAEASPKKESDIEDPARKLYSSLGNDHQFFFNQHQEPLLSLASLAPKKLKVPFQNLPCPSTELPLPLPPRPAFPATFNPREEQNMDQKDKVIEWLTKVPIYLLEDSTWFNNCYPCSVTSSSESSFDEEVEGASEDSYIKEVQSRKITRYVNKLYSLENERVRRFDIFPESSSNFQLYEYADGNLQMPQEVCDEGFYTY